MCVCVFLILFRQLGDLPHIPNHFPSHRVRSSPGRAKGKAKAKAKAADPVVQEEEEEVLGLSRGGLKSRD